ncbi:hypothetical protein J6590_060752 [Homalodisca vitripennis]|nr:hypothetical protein J6590_060752 [Homalodisca vitripennis]
MERVEVIFIPNAGPCPLGLRGDLWIKKLARAFLGIEGAFENASIDSMYEVALGRTLSIFSGSEVTEEQLLQKEFITPEDVLSLPKITEEYLCLPEANIYDIDFVRFKIRDWESGTVLFEIAKPTVPPVPIFYVCICQHQRVCVRTLAALR